MTDKVAAALRECEERIEAAALKVDVPYVMEAIARAVEIAEQKGYGMTPEWLRNRRSGSDECKRRT